MKKMKKQKKENHQTECTNNIKNECDLPFHTEM